MPTLVNIQLLKQCHEAVDVMCVTKEFKFCLVYLLDLWINPIMLPTHKSSSIEFSPPDLNSKTTLRHDQ